MKLIIVATLYVIGIFVCAFWLIGTEEYEKVIEESNNKNPAVSTLPEGYIKLATFLATIFASMLWPIRVVSMPVKAIKNLLK